VLEGRRVEREALDRLLQRVRAGQSAVLVLRGEAGVGKSSLLEYVAEQASGCHVVRIAGVEAEMELAFAGLHQLCAPLLDGLDALPEPQRDALRVAFGMQGGDAPERFLVALAGLSLLAGAAEAEPLVCLVDDVQWLDRASALVARWSAVGVDRRADPRPGRRRAALRELDHPPSLAEVDVTGPGDGAVAVVGDQPPARRRSRRLSSCGFALRGSTSMSVPYRASLVLVAPVAVWASPKSIASTSAAGSRGSGRLS